MKLVLLLSSLLAMAVSSKSCKEKLPPGCYKGRLEVKGICMNYTISMLNTSDTSLVMRSWTDEQTGKEYENVFALGSRCTFPDSLQVGDEFYFTIDTTTVQNCSVCMAWYPVPVKKLSIKVLNAPCTQ